MDLIDRRQLLQHFDNCLKTGGFNAYIVAIQCYVEQMPTIEPKRGEWVDVDLTGYADKNDIHCGVCFRYATEKTNFCPNCGADMRGEEDD